MTNALFRSSAAILSLIALTGSTVASAQALPTTPAAAQAEELAGQMPPSAFFSVPLTPGPEGSLIGSEAASGFRLPPGAQATRILYRSSDADGQLSLASATVVTPGGKAPEGGWPLLVWAHGTTGVAQQCGPSVTKSVGYYVQPLVAQGFAVIAVDYAGLSTPGGHHYMTTRANATDVANAVPAARKAVPGLSAGWVAIGHSQGGQAVWGLAHLETTRNDPGYLGGLALAPGVGGADLLESVANHEGQTFYPVYYAYAIKRQFPDFDVRKLLSDTAMPHYDALTRDGCWDYAYATFLHTKTGTVLRKGWKNDPTVQKFVAMNLVANGPIKGPLFVAAGRDDTAVPLPLVTSIVNQQRRYPGEIIFKQYPGEHDPMMKSSFADQMQWLKDRFSKAPG